MPNELTNLLPPERKRALFREYVLRIGVVIAVLITALTLSAAVLLIPTYVLLQGSAKAKNIRLANVTATLSSADETALRARLATLGTSAATLVTLAKTSTVSAIIQAVLAISHPGITLSSLSYAPSDKSAKILTVSGLSATRDALRSYQLALQGASFARSAVLPVSAYASDSNIAFTITITLLL